MLGMERVVSLSEDYYAISCPSSVGARMASLNHDLELRSSSFTLGRVRACSTLLSLNHDLFPTLNIDAVSRRNA